MLSILLLSFSLMAADLYWPPMHQYRGYLRLAVTPVEWFVDAPNRLWSSVDALLADRGEVAAENSRLQADLLIMARKLQRLEALNNENLYLRKLLNASVKLDDRVMMAELIGVNPDPFIHQITINKGLRDRVYLGQPVLDAGGVMGQVVEVGPYTARVLLITDAQHAIPVQVLRNGFRALLLGEGQPHELTLDHVPDTADIRVDDVLVSSGLGQRFPAGYPVAKVTEIVHDPGQPFALIHAEPTARLSTSRHLLLVFRQDREYLQPPEAEDAP